MLLELNGLEVDCILGDLPEERDTPRRIRVDIALTVSDRVATTDDLEDTVDYAALVGKVRAALVAARARMIERAARIVADVCRREPHVFSVRVKVTKAGAVEGLASAAATIED